MITVTSIRIIKTYQSFEFLSGKKVSAHDVAICMLLVKVARLKNRKTEDCYIDMAGYAAIAGEIHEQEDDADSLFQPPSEWTPPERLPDLSDAKEIAIDLETYDPNIKDRARLGSW